MMNFVYWFIREWLPPIVVGLVIMELVIRYPHIIHRFKQYCSQLFNTEK